MRKTRIVLPVLLALGPSVQVAAYSSSGTSLQPDAAGASGTIDSSACPMVSTSFTFKLSANVGAAWNCSTTAGAVNAGSTKGSKSYGGSTSGGAVTVCSSDVDSTNGYSAVPASELAGCGDGEVPADT